MRTILFAVFLCLPSLAAQAQGAPTVYRGACDGSAAAALDANHFVAANDDENSLRIYRIGTPKPIATVDLNDVLEPEKKKDKKTPKEVDIEGAARVGDRIYWIGSHARDSKGDEETSRHRFFATEIKPGGANGPSILPPTRSYADLLKHLIALLPELDSKDPPEEKKGFNIEGLAATPQGGLLIGLRNPRPNDKAIVVQLTNPDAVVPQSASAKPAPPQFGSTSFLDLGGRGIRSIEYIGDRYVIVAGPFGDGDNDFALYSWAGPGSEAKPEASLVVGNLKPEMLFNFKPEALFATSNPKEVYLLSDDGTDTCKDLKDSNEKTFRGITVRLD